MYRDCFLNIGGYKMVFPIIEYSILHSSPYLWISQIKVKSYWFTADLLLVHTRIGNNLVYKNCSVC